MPKMKNRRAAQKRFSTTGTGKLKRFHARARGRGNSITKRTCHIKVVVSDQKKAKG